MSTLKVNNVQDLGADAVVTNGVVNASALPAGSILQVVSTTKTDTFSTSSNSYVDITGLSVTITPSSATSKILVMAMVTFGMNGAAQLPALTLADGSNNNLIAASSPGSRTVGFSGAHGEDTDSLNNAHLSLLHSPNTTSAFTYKIRGAMVGAATMDINRSGVDTDTADWMRSISTITAMEVAG